MAVKSQPYGTVRNMSAPASALPILAEDAPATAGLPRSRDRDARRKAILEIAREAFMREGYAAASMSAIATRLGGSKGTLYNYFPSKEELFAAVVSDECEAEFLAMVDFQPEQSLEQSLRMFGGRFLRFALSETGLGFHRLLSAEAGRFPELGRAFYAAGPARNLQRISTFLQARMDAGEMRGSDPEQAGAFLIGLLKSNLHHRRVWNVLDDVDEASLDAHVDAAVHVFLNGYAA